MSKVTETNETQAYEIVNDMIEGLRDIMEKLQGYYIIEEEIKYEYEYVSKRIQHFLIKSTNLVNFTNPYYEKPNYTLMELKRDMLQVNDILKSLEDNHNKDKAKLILKDKRIELLEEKLETKEGK